MKLNFILSCCLKDICKCIIDIFGDCFFVYGFKYKFFILDGKNFLFIDEFLVVELREDLEVLYLENFYCKGIEGDYIVEDFEREGDLFF